MIEIIVLAYYTILGSFGVILNGILLYLSIFRSPSQIKTYRVLIINFALTDMLSSIFMMLIAPRIIPLDLAMAHIFYGLCHYAEHLRSETKSIHKQLLKALTLQACLPFLFSGGVFIFYIQASGLTTHPILECLICAIPAPIPILSSIISLYHIRPYRQALLRIFTRITIPIPTNDHHSSAVVLAPKHKISISSSSRLHRLSLPNNS
ncbi:hypothetical protein L3Y34_008370 [Caenorhabditis briggsae]|uniref:G-protein coupled receptors family 1 profile domain-containing protein n=1 Tax=Caenorhabditis briggsae TaxID=6238 RepID=A0AAE9A244_CAEBR|nr:hypothetical protein L3Y34_008370 [Caenorhabditis briggsae]